MDNGKLFTVNVDIFDQVFFSRAVKSQYFVCLKIKYRLDNALRFLRDLNY